MKIFLYFLYVVILILGFLLFAYGIHQGNIEGALQSTAAVILTIYTVGRLRKLL